MKVVFEASSNIEAHLVKHQLQQAGIDAEIEGEHLQGAIGLLPAMGNVRVVVPDAETTLAREVIVDWEAN